MEGEELKAGKQRVHDHLIEPLSALGFVRRRGSTVTAHEGAMESLAARLAYMREGNLLTLAEVVENNGFGPDRLVWPQVKLILTWACALQAPAASESRLVRSYLQSVPGQAALDGGYVVELRMFLKKNGRPPSEYEMCRIRDEAASNGRERSRIKASKDAGSSSEHELKWEADYLRAHQTCRNIIAAKHDRTAA